jgi:hypothetical protein
MGSVCKISRLTAGIIFVMVVCAACGAQPSNYTSGNSNGISSGSGSSAGSDGTSASGTIGYTSLGSDPTPINYTKSASYRAIIKMDTAFEGGTRSSRDFTVKVNDSNFDILLDQ